MKKLLPSWDREKREVTYLPLDEYEERTGFKLQTKFSTLKMVVNGLLIFIGLFALSVAVFNLAG